MEDLLSHERPSRATAPRGFTLVEVIIVAALLLVVGAFVVPRMVGVSKGEFRVTTEGVAAALSAFAFHESTDERIVGIAYLENTGRVDVMILDDEGEWIPMPMAPSLVLPADTGFASVVADGAQLDPRDWFVASVPGGRRPDIRLRLENESGSGADVVLTPHGLGPVIVADDDPDAPVIREPADLKEIGADREPW
ncbi:MAG: type II secretion system protein [Planctomycetota bacterium]|nr:type II secretion system protein [Planctomycetota bacterium]